MFPLHPLFALSVFAIAFATAFLINLKFKIAYLPGRYETIDSLRGFLAIGVFIHHAAIWHQYLETGKWAVPQSTLYAELGATSVSIFFMITSFLFVTKLLNTGEKEFQWCNFFISRIFRLVPMYYFSLLLIIILAMALTQWQFQVSFAEFLNSIWHWLIFTIAEEKPINGYAFTNWINAGVTWSLPYEWLFYFSLPLIGLLLLRKKPAKIVLAASVLFIVIFVFVHPINMYHMLAFASGAVAPFLLKYTSAAQKTGNAVFSFAIIGCFVLMTLIDKAYVHKFLIAIVFTLVAMGNSVFGLLRNNTLKFLGEICYSTYLLHGILLFIAMHFIIGTENASLLTPAQYCAVIFAVTPVLVVCSFLGFHLIEKPFMDWGKKIGK